MYQIVGLQFQLPPVLTVNFPVWVRSFLINPHYARQIHFLSYLF